MSVRNRLLVAVQQIEHASATRSVLKFFHYWVALEVAADTDKTGKIIKLLGSAYGQRENDNVFVQNTLGFTALKNIRNSIFHDGASYEMSPSVERYFQRLLLDVIRARLKLSCERYMEKAILDGFDVTWLSLNGGKAEAWTIPQNI